MAAFRFGVDSFIWTEVFSEKDLDFAQGKGTGL